VAVLAVLASRYDAVARSFAERQGAVLLTPRDLSTAGWRIEPGRPERSVAVLWGRQVTAAEMGRVVVRLSHVDEAELVHIRKADRAFVAAEMQSFLVTWLTMLGKRILNLPSPAQLLGPIWRVPRWSALAEEIGISAQTGPPPANGFQAITVLGGECVGTWPQRLAAQAGRMAAAAGLGLSRAWFVEVEGATRLVGFDLWPDLESPEVEAAIAAWQRGEVC
jgi:hypothetical protein